MARKQTKQTERTAKIVMVAKSTGRTVVRELSTFAKVELDHTDFYVASELDATDAEVVDIMTNNDTRPFRVMLRDNEKPDQAPYPVMYEAHDMKTLYDTRLRWISARETIVSVEEA